jgi:gamma-glutamyltranspeptidase/glutathione hydrolase
VFARNVVSTSHPLAAQAGLRMLHKGGNAVDAAIAAAAAITLVEPVSNGLGSDAFAILWDGKELHGLNASGRAPQTWTPEYFKRKYGADAKAPPKRGMDSVTVPGAVASWVALSERFGKLPFADLMEPSHRDCRARLPAAPRGAAEVGRRHARAAGPAGLCRHLLALGPRARSGRAVPVQGRRARRCAPLPKPTARPMYGGEIAEAIEKFAAANGGSMTAQRLCQPTSPSGSSPFRKNYRGYTLHEIPPNGQGIAALIALGILDKFDVASLPWTAWTSQHLQIEAMKLAFADVYRYVAEPANMEVTAEQMLDDAYLASARRSST